MSRHLARAMMDASLEIGEAASNSAVTIAGRLPVLARLDVAGVAEWQACVAEKSSAAWDGAVDLASAWQASFVNALLSPLTPTGLAHEALALARVASGPANARVRANAIRFGRG